MNVPTTASVQTRTAPRLRRWLVIATVAAGLSGCAGALGVYVPGSGNKAGTYRTATSLGNGLARIDEHDYAIGRDGFGLALGAKVGRAWSSMGSVTLSPGLAGEAHADVGYARGRFGGLVSAAFGDDRGYTSDQTEARYGGLSVGVVGQAVVVRRIAVHGGLHRLVTGNVAVGDRSAHALGWRLGAGADATVYRGTKNEFILRADVRHSSSSAVTLDGADVTWSGTALLGELVWISTP